MSNPPNSASNTAAGSFSLFGKSSTGNTSDANPGSTTAPSNSFGGPQKSLFGGGVASGGFGSVGQGGSSNLFGSFGKKAEEKKEDASAISNFGIFGTPNKTLGFENAGGVQTPSLFGGAAVGSSTPATTQPSFSFANPSTTPAGPPPTTGAGGLFSLGQGPTNSAGLFGVPSAKQQPQSAPATSSIFGNKAIPSPTMQAPSLFGSATSKTGSNLFGEQQASQPSGGLFSKIGGYNTTAKETPNANWLQQNPGQSGTQPSLFSPASSGQPKSTFTLAGGASSSTGGQSNTQPTLFSPASAGQPKPPFTSAGGASSSTGDKAAVKPSFQIPSLDALGTQTSTLEGASSATTQKPSLFSGATSSASPAPATNLFADLGRRKETTTSESTTQSASITASTTTPSVGAAATALPPFNLSNPRPGTTTSQSAEAANTAAPAAGSTTASNGINFGGSTVGPIPTAQSRLKNKSMDEIITRWASDLSKYQKEFQAQAEKVAAWDRMLVDNSNAISKLYSKTFQAERDTAEVQKQLTTVESHQDELSHWLDTYERQVDEMMSRQMGQGDALQGPDQDRERTYVLFH